MTLLASSNSPRLQHYCVLVQSKHYGKAPFLLVSLGGTRRVCFGPGRVNAAPCQGTLVPPSIAPAVGEQHRATDGQTYRWMDRGDPSVVRTARAVEEEARTATQRFWLIWSISTASCKGDELYQHPCCHASTPSGVAPVAQVPWVPAALRPPSSAAPLSASPLALTLQTYFISLPDCTARLIALFTSHVRPLVYIK